jgi:futalosine hydrolase
MSFKVLYVTATSAETVALRKVRDMSPFAEGFRSGNLELSILVAGIGTVQTVYNMSKWLSKNGKPDVAINAGIAGTFRDKYRIGDVVMPVNECFADAGIEDGDNFNTLFETGLADPDEFPFSGGMIKSHEKYVKELRHVLKPVSAITVNTATGSDMTKSRLVRKYNPDIETMEGASFFYICARENIPFFAIRAISNRIETRNRDKWNIPLAMERLSIKLGEILKTLE